MNLPKNTFDQDVVVTLETAELSSTEGYEFFGKPISVNVKGQETVRLNEPATLTIKIHSEQLGSIEKEENIYAAYFNGENWEFFSPDSVNLKDGTAVFTTYHFSSYSIGKLSRDEQLKYYAKQMAANTWAKEEQEKNFVAKFEGYVNDMLSDVYGIENKETTRKILQTMVKEIPYMGGMLVSAANGDETEFAENFASAAGKVILDQMELEGDAAGDLVTIASTHGKVAGDMSEDDYEEALKDITKGLATAIISKNLVGKMMVAGAEIIDVAITDWKDKNIEDAYEAYKNGADGDHGYDLDAGDFEQLKLQMRGINHKIYSDGINAYLKRNKISRSDLTKEQEEAIKNDIDRKLKQEFDNRILKESEVDKQKDYHEKILRMFEERGLLEEGSLGYEFGMTLQDRIESVKSMDKNIKWTMRVPIFKSSVILKQLFITVGIPFGLVAIFILIMSGDSSETKFAVGLVLTTLILTYFLIKAVYVGKYDLNFIIDEKGIKCSEDKKQQKKSKALNILAIAAGIIANKPAVSGAGILAQSRSTVFIPWEEIRKAKYSDGEHAIEVYGKFPDSIYLFCTEHNYQEIKELIQKSTN